MTVARQDYQIEYAVTASSPSEFPFEFGAMDARHVVAYDINPDLSPSEAGYRELLADAVVQPDGRGIRHGGVVRTPTRPAAGHTLLIRRETPVIQEMTYQTQREMDPTTVELALDYLTYTVQEAAGSGGGEATGDWSEIIDQIDALASTKADRSELTAAVASLQSSIASLRNEAATDAELESVRASLAQSIQTLTNTKADKTELTVALAVKADTDTVNAALAGKADLNHTQAISTVTGLQAALDAKASTTTVNTALAAKADVNHTQAMSTITGLSVALDAKADAAAVNAALADKASLAQLALKIGDAPLDGKLYARSDGAWVETTASGGEGGGGGNNPGGGNLNIVGQTRYFTADGGSLSYTVGHAMNSTAVIPLVYNDATGAPLIVEIGIPNKDEIVVSTTAPLPAGLRVRVVMVAVNSDMGGGGEGLPDGGNPGDLLAVDSDGEAAWQAPPVASETALGMIKVDGASATVDADGTLRVVGGGSGGGEGGTTDHRLLENRNAPGQHNLIALTYGEGVNEAPLKDLLDAMSAIIDGKADASALASYATTTAMTAALLNKADTNHTQAISTVTGLQPALDAKIDAATFSAMMATKAPLSSGIIDTTLTKSGTSFVVDTAPFPSPLPQYVTVRAKAPAAYAAGDTLTVNSTAVPLTTPGGMALPANAWASGSGVELTIDTTGNKAFFKYGVGESSGGGGTVEWAIFPGMTPNENSAPGLYIPGADTPTLTMIDGHFVITGLGGGRVVEIIAGSNTAAYFLLENKTAWSCGYNNYGQLGRSVANGSAIATNLGQIATLTGVIGIAAGGNAAYFLLENKTVWSCGYNNAGQLGRSVANGSATATNLGQITTLTGVIGIAASSNAAYFLLENKTVWSCGTNNAGQLGRNVANGSATATNLGQITTLTGVIGITTSDNAAFFLLENKTVWSCGQNNAGQLGRSVATGSVTATNLGQIATLTGVIGIAAGGSAAYFLLENKTVWSCGNNAYGQLGRSVATGSVTATNLGQITTLTGVVGIAAGGNTAYFLLENKTVWSCGQNNAGQLGRSVATGSVTATNLGQIATLTGVIGIAAGSNTAFFLLENKSVWSCGNNVYGQLGRNVMEGSEENTNLGSIDVLYGGTESIHANGTLMIEVGDAGLADSAPVLVTDDATLSLPVTQVYQTKNGIDQRLEFIVKAA